MSEEAMELFQAACGAAGPLALRVETGYNAVVFQQALSQPYAVLGRGFDADLQLPHEDVSHRHAYVQLLSGRLFCIDLASRTGIHWEGSHRRVGWLSRDQHLGIGPYRVHFLSGYHDPDSVRPKLGNPLLSHGLDQAGLPDVSLAFTEGSANHLVWPMHCVVALLGRSPDCKIKLGHVSASRYHCSLVRTPGGLWVVDLLGRDGTRVNGRSVRCCRLDDGDELKVGKFFIRVHCGTAQPGRMVSPDEEESGVSLGTPSDGSLAELPSVDRFTSSGNLPSPAPSVRAPMVAEPPESILLAPEEGGPPAGLAEAIVVPLVQQFALMQQQMFDQFQHSMLTIVQMFRSMHADQARLVRHELDHLRRLTEELRGLQAELSKRPAAAAPTANGAAEKARPAPPPSKAWPAERPAAPASTPPAAAAARAASVPGTTPPRPPGDADAKEIHAWLCQRMASVQQERQSRLQRILGLFTGKQPEESTL